MAMAAAAAEIEFGMPVNLELGEALVDLGAEQRDGQHVIVLALDDSDGFAHMAISPEQAELLADALLGLAHISQCSR